MRTQFKTAVFCLAAFALWAGVCAAAETRRTITVKEKVTSSSPELKLRDFVDNLEVLTDEEKALDVMESPSEKTSKTISIVDLAYALQRHPKLMALRISGPKQIRLFREIDNQFIDKAKEELTAFLKKSPPWSEWKIEVLIKSDDVRKIAKLGPFDHLEIINRDAKATLGPIDLRVVFLDTAKKRLAELDINPVVLREVMVAVLSGSLEKGQVIGKSDIKMAPVMLGQEKRNFIIDMTEHYGKELRTRVAVGDYLSVDDLLDPMCAKRGDVVKVFCKLGTMSVTTVGQAMQAGRRGEVVKVRNLTSGKVLSVTLTEDKGGKVEL